MERIDKELWDTHKLIWCQRLVDNLQQVYAKRTVQIPCKPFTEPAAPTPAPAEPPQKKEEPEPEAEEKPKREVDLQKESPSSR